ncbi:hypothetical protein [Alteromonas sp. 14N.309.X.WAT.G.H12]|uniref:hypothetical protein n=1 Tax=Alteromonas sp. 14N.309.X.WAT.G.H12 TaxID=3120824 RepID=UPI002FD3D987
MKTHGITRIENHHKKAFCEAINGNFAWFYDEFNNGFRETICSAGKQPENCFPTLREAQKYAHIAFIEQARCDIKNNQPLLNSWLGIYRLYITRNIGSKKQKEAIESFLSSLAKRQLDASLSIDEFLETRSIDPVPAIVKTSPLLHLGDELFRVNARQLFSLKKLMIEKLTITACDIINNEGFSHADGADFLTNYTCDTGFTFSTQDGVNEDVVLLKRDEMLFRNEDVLRQYIEEVRLAFTVEVKNGDWGALNAWTVNQSVG